METNIGRGAPEEPPTDQAEGEAISWGEVVDESRKGQGDGGGIPTTIQAPNLTSGADPVSDTERLRLRQYTLSVGGVALLEAARRLNSAGVDRRIETNGIRRWLEIGLPPRHLKQMHDQRKYRFQKLMGQPGDNPVQKTIYLPPGYHNGKNYMVPVPESAPEAPESYKVDQIPQHFWVLDMFKTERASREFTGFMCIPNYLLAMRLRSLLEERGLWEPLKGASSKEDLNPQQRLDIVQALSHAEAAVTKHFYQYPNVGWVYDKQFLPSAEAVGLSENLDEFADTFYRWMRAQGRYEFWLTFESTSRRRDRAHRVQDIPEAIAAAEALDDLVSAVMTPLSTSEIEQGKGKNWKTGAQEDKFGVLIHWGTEDVRYANGDELHDPRKTIGGIQGYLMLHRTAAEMLLTLAHVKTAGDDWYPGSWDGVKKKDFMLSFPELPDVANDVLQQVLFGPYAECDDDFVIDPGPMVGEWHNRRIFRVIDSFNTLIEMAEHVREGGIFTDKDMRERWLPKLVQFANDDLVRGWWDEEFDNGEGYPKGKLFAEYDKKYPRREFRAVPYYDWFYWQDPGWVMGIANDGYVFRQIVEYVIERFREAGMPESVKIEIDGADPNYFRHHDTAWEIVRNQPKQAVIRRLKKVWNREVNKGTTHIRPVYYREVLAELSQELLVDLPTPDKEYVKPFRDETSTQLAAATNKKEIKDLEKKLAVLNRCLRKDAKDLDPFTRFVQKLNRDSDARVRMWAGFESHARDGDIMAFLPPEAIGYVKEGYAFDTGAPYEDHQAHAVDLVTFAWINPQFNSAVWLARELHYHIFTKVDPMERHKAVAAAQGRGLHPAIANYIVEGFGGWERWIVPVSESKAELYVKKIFEIKEVEQLGRELVKKLLPKELMRKEMRLQIIT